MKHLHYYMVQLCCTCLLLICFFCYSCKKFVTPDLPIDKVTAAYVFENEETATAALLGIYSQMMSTSPFVFSGGTSVFAGLSSDELYLTNAAAAPEEAEFEKNALQPNNSTLWNNFWVRSYKHIYGANACIEKLPASNNLSASVKSRLLGEAKLVRAFCYFYLVNLFGDVPLITTTEYEVNGRLPRTAALQVYQQIISDLREAKEALPAAYPTADRVRPNKWAAAALLARVYLYTGDWAKAEAEATEVINAGLYSLMANLNTVFLSASREAIWQLMPVESGFNTSEARFLAASTTAGVLPTYALSSSLLGAFEGGDARKAAWIGTKTVNGQAYGYPFKYKVRGLGLPVTEYYILLRFAETLLIRSEARAHQNKISEAQADINQVRTRAGLSATTATTGAALVVAVEQERRIEFLAEWGHRWLDLKRTGRINTVLSAVKPNWQDTKALFPIPQSEILRNPALLQNRGY